MAMQLEFSTAGRILFGDGKVREVPAAAAAMGRRALVVTGASPERAAPLVASLEAAGVACLPWPVAGEPTVETVRRGNEYARAERCDLVVAIGGGSAIDAGKALAAMLANPGELLDYLEVIGRAHPLEHASAPFIAIPRRRGRVRKSPATPCWLPPSTASRPVCAAVRCCPSWRWWTPN